MKKLFLILLGIFLISCQSEEAIINEQSFTIFNNSIDSIKKSKYFIVYSLDSIGKSKPLVNIDSFKYIYETYKSESPQKGLEFAKEFELYVNKILKESEIENIRYLAWFDSFKGDLEKEGRLHSIESQKSWEKSKYGKLQKKHPEWSKDECRRVIDGEIWIGMTLDMLKYQRGLPDNANPSNYGNGVKWQWCWHDHSPRCFYGGEDGIITAYN